MKLGKVINHNILIQPAANKGFIVEVGCGRFAFSCVHDLIESLASYFNDPEKYEKEYSKLFVDCTAEPDTACEE